MSDIYGEGHGSAHDWKYCWSSPSKSYYQCARCGHKFAHAYDSIPDIFQAMKQQSVPAECQPGRVVRGGETDQRATGKGGEVE